MKTQLQAYQAIQKRLPIQDENVKKRMQRAWQEVLSPAYEITVLLGGDYFISKLDSESYYTVSLEHGCNCPDTFTARAGLCKHRIAVMILEEMKED